MTIFRRFFLWIVLVPALFISLTATASAMSVVQQKKAYPPHQHHHWRHPPQHRHHWQYPRRHVHQNYLAPRHIYRPRYQAYRYHPYFVQRHMQPRQQYASIPFVMQQRFYYRRYYRYQQVVPFVQNYTNMAPTQLIGPAVIYNRQSYSTSFEMGFRGSGFDYHPQYRD